MTLLITEIHPIGVLPDPVIVFAADRRISSGNRYHSTRKKLFAVPSYNAGLGFFGLAKFTSGRKTVEMSDWLKNFITRNSSNPGTLKDLADGLARDLNSLVPDSLRRKEISGFHLAGVNDEGMPEFWFIRNVEDDRTTISGRYSAREDFLSRDARNLITGEFATYRNGDIRGHAAFWERLDEALFALFQESDFRRPQTSQQYADWVKFKMEVLAYFYKQYCNKATIGRPIDTLVITNGRFADKIS